MEDEIKQELSKICKSIIDKFENIVWELDQENICKAAFNFGIAFSTFTQLCNILEIDLGKENEQD